MKTWFLASACIAAGVVGAVTLRAAGPSVSPSEGGISRNVSLSGFEFVMVKKPKVTLVPRAMQTAKRKVTPKLLAFSAAQIDLQVTTGVAGVYDVLVTPKDRGVAKVTLPDPFTILLPAPATVEPASGPVAVPVAILGTEFGIYKGKVTIGGRAAKVTRWMADRIEVTAPKRLAPGGQLIVVTNRAGKSTAVLGYTVNSTTTGTPSRLFKYDVGSFHFETTTQEPYYFGSSFNVSQDFFGVGASGKPSGLPSMALNINHPALATPMPYVVTTGPTATGTTTATYAANGSVYQAFPDSNFTITVTAYADGVIEGTFAGELSIVAGPGPSPITVTNGQFKALVDLVGQ